MQFSDTTNKTGIIQRCELLTGLGDAAISGNTTLLKQFTALINSAYHKTVSMILESQDDWDFDETTNTSYPIGTTSLVASQRDYTFPASLLKIKRVDVTYNGTTWYRAMPLDTSLLNFGLGNDTDVDGNFTKTSPRYDLKSDSIWIYPLASASDVSSGAKVRVEWLRDITEFASTDTTAVPGFDKIWHDILPLLASHTYAVANDQTLKIQTLAAQVADWEARLRRYFGKRDEDIQYVLKSDHVNYL